jgi:ubiquinone/menaquinone biosynthesis C-methylase UbiE
MDEEERRVRADSFGEVAPAYAAHRPGYPEDAVAWLVGAPPARVLELGAGTGKLTATLCALGHDVVATDPSPAMLAELRTAVPKARTVLARAEDIPLPPSSVDIVVAGQAFHWFDHEHALPEIARVLKPGGTVALVWNVGDFRVPWVRKVFGLIDVQTDGQGEDPFAASDIFVLIEQRTVKHWQTFKQDTMEGFVASSSRAATMSVIERDALVAEAARLYESYDRGPDGLLMPWVSYCYRGRVAGLERAAAPATHDERDPDDETVVISFS